MCSQERGESGDALVATVALQLCGSATSVQHLQSIQNDAEQLLVQAKRNDLLVRTPRTSFAFPLCSCVLIDALGRQEELYANQGRFQRALQVCEESDRIHVKTVHYRQAKHLG